MRVVAVIWMVLAVGITAAAAAQTPVDSGLVRYIATIRDGGSPRASGSGDVTGDAAGHGNGRPATRSGSRCQCR